MNSYRSHDWLHEPEIIAELIISVLYVITLIIYLIFLGIFNKRMKNEGLTDAFVNKIDILRTSESILNEGGNKYVIWAFLLILAFIIVIAILVYLRNHSYYKGISLIIIAVFIIVSIVLFIVLWNMINMPVFRAFMFVMGAVGISSALIGTSN
ncbi:hypothetical protein [Limosilactobacillus reuteri]|uniref:Uncharacterized protein n=1 Tax=Limosilactobacillus reuteri TaxID=1598 RepID=A0AB36AC13_LIMRT|nr:hypothetical protein [Limosilactobacillus reuteri]MCH5357579.1 hypothetical protein [Limosilactobacillus reuteri]MQB76087.1 hypothetical protein [Limosilactobacillus reuteri]MQB98126.1 hypothetical protein [Limosilactobacillus reuteri]MRG83240.1 hypothetical protein [Limosilactobacillus reuteri]